MFLGSIGKALFAKPAAAIGSAVSHLTGEETKRNNRNKLTGIADQQMQVYNQYMPQLLGTLSQQSQAPAQGVAPAYTQYLTSERNNMMGDMQRTGAVGGQMLSAALARRGIAGTQGGASTALNSGLSDYYDRLQRSTAQQMLGVDEQLYQQQDTVSQREEAQRRQALLTLLQALSGSLQTAQSGYGQIVGQDQQNSAALGNMLGGLLGPLGLLTGMKSGGSSQPVSSGLPGIGSVQRIL